MRQFRSSGLRWDIAIVLAVKLLALIFIWGFWFQHSSAPVDGDAVRSHFGLSAVEPSVKGVNDAGP